MALLSIDYNVLKFVIVVSFSKTKIVRFDT